MAEKMDFHVQARADFQEINKLRKELENLKRTAEQTGKMKVELPLVESLDDVKALRKEMDAITKMAPHLDRMVKRTGATSISGVNLNQTYSTDTGAANVAARILGQIGSAVDKIVAQRGGKTPNVPAVPGGGGGGGGGQSPWRSAGWNVLNSGLNGAGSWGGAVSGGLGGFGGSFGAGAIGMIGGLAALAVGKLVSAIAERVGNAQQQQILTDRIMRASGISGYSSRLWSGAMYAGANGSGMKVNEFTQLVGSFQRSANFRGSPLGVASAVQHGVEFGQGFGMDQGAAVPFFAKASGLNIASNQQQLQKLGLFLGEGIVKSGAFGQSQRFMEAAGDFMQSQSRVALNGGALPNYIGALSGMVGMNVPGLDVEGSAQVLGNANANIMKGGAHGEASQMLMARMAMANGMKSPYELRVLQEGGMFATKDSMFGEGSEYAKHFGNSGPKGSKTVLEMVKEQLARSYGKGSKDYYLAMQNHFGIGLNQAMAFDRLKPEDIKQATTALEGSGVNLENLNASAITDLVNVNSGRNGGLKGVVGNMLSSKNPYKLSSEEKQQLRDASQGGDQGALKELTNELLAKHGQAETEGSKTRDALAKIDNTIQSYADKAVPALNMMMMAAVNAGGGEEAVRKQYADNMAKERSAQLSVDFKTKRDKIQGEIDALTNAGVGMQDKEGYAKLTALKAQMSELNTQEETARAQIQEGVNKDVYGTSMGYISSDMAKGVKSQKFDKDTIARMKGMNKDIVDAATAANIDPDWFRAQIATESNFRNDRTSSAGAKGAGQLMPGNTKGINPWDQRQNLFRSAKVYADFQKARPNASRSQVLRMYNGGWNPPNNTESLQYPHKVEANYNAIQALKEQGVFDDTSAVKAPDQAVGQPKPVVVAGSVDVNLQHPEGQKQVVQAPVATPKTGFNQPGAFANRNVPSYDTAYGARH